MQRNGSIEMLEYSLLMDKVQKFLLENAKVTYVKPGEAEEAKPEEKKSAANGKKTAEKTNDSEPAEKPAAKKKVKAEETDDTENKGLEKAKKAKSTKKASKATKSEE